MCFGIFNRTYKRNEMEEENKVEETVVEAEVVEAEVVEEKKEEVVVCPADPAEASQCDSCQ